jgi:hypothetical protein
MCDRWKLYIEYLKSTPDNVIVNEAVYSAHLATCPTCAAEMRARAAGPDNPELTRAEIEAA